MGARRRLGAVCGLVATATAIVALTVPAAIAEDRTVTVWDASGGKPTPCPDMRITHEGEEADVEGGCVFDVNGRDIALRIHGIVGDLDFVRCFYNHQLHVDSRGRTLMSRVLAAGPQPCNDARVCVAEDRKPWPGQIHVDRDGELYNLVRACFDTCMGQFRGTLRLSLSRHDGAWRETVDRDMLGSSGLEVDGRWRLLRSKGLEIRTGADGKAP